jgi:phosphoserine phosphatase
LVVVSASPAFGVEPACVPLDVPPDDIRAIQPALDAQSTCLPDVLTPITYREGKVDAIRALTGGARPLVALGDSAGDLPMLAFALRAVAVQPRPAVLAAARAEPERFRVLRFARTVSGVAITPPLVDRVVV